jgi:hypothetical protein
MARGFSADEEAREAANSPEAFKLMCFQREKFNGLIGPGIKSLFVDSPSPSVRPR